jgi:hypothetical protein
MLAILASNGLDELIQGLVTTTSASTTPDSLGGSGSFCIVWRILCAMCQAVR